MGALMRSPTVILLALACTLAACGSDGPAPLDSGIPDEKTGAELTADEQEQLCTANVDHLSDQSTVSEKKKFACVAVALLFADASSFNRDECESLVQMCLKENSEPENDGEDMCILPFDPANCDAAIADIEACLTEQNEAAGAVIRGTSCSSIEKSLAEDDGDNDEVVDGPACTKLQTTCPSITAAG